MDAYHVTRFARVDFRNDDRVFGIKDEDRFLHVYVVWKTGTGKSTLIETMALLLFGWNPYGSFTQRYRHLLSARAQGAQATSSRQPAAFKPI